MRDDPPDSRTTRAVVLLSGGLDSAVALWWALRRGWEVHALAFDYHARPERERRAAHRLAEAARVRLTAVPLPFLREAADLEAGPWTGNAALADAPPGYVPARNLVFYGIASHAAEALGATRVVGGHIGSDAETFGDASRAFFDGLKKLNATGLWTGRARPLSFELPLKGLTKREVVALGVSLGVPFVATWSCYEDAAAPCGACPSCVERRGAFADVGVADPALA
ncbi:MAG TPA: 7-cyano-7-deazaguanine synthase [Candidatus Thermoplasmatota archaeon]|nr:7-cyano-7-deazaguanine synthase [Candidatus Thermoplasmatota archaeon]